MKVLIVTLLFASSVRATTSLCELFDSQFFANFEAISAPNCYNNTLVKREIRSSERDPAVASDLCGQCRSDLNARIQIPAEDRKKLKQRAYLNVMYNEFEKGMSSLVTDMVSIRKLYSTGSNYSQAASKCSAEAYNRKLNSCGNTQKQLLLQKNFSGRMANELANLLSPSPLALPGILDRTSNNQCPISDESLISLKPLLFENSLKPEIVNRIIGINARTKDDLYRMLGGDIANLVKHHPILSNLASNPSEFVAVFRRLNGETDPEKLKAKFRNNVYTPANGNKLDSQIANRCEQSINAFFDKVCSRDFNSGNISLGPFSNFEKLQNDEEYPENTSITTEELLSQNMTMLEFCETPRAGSISPTSDSTPLNNWLTDDERSLHLAAYSQEKYRSLFGGPKRSLCAYEPAGCNDDSENCKLYKLYKQTQTAGTPEFRLANSPDPKVNEMLRSFIGQPQGLPTETQQVLIREGILPQSNGQFVERPSIPEREPEYLAGVANGTITPASSSSSSQAAASSRTQRRPSQAQAQAQVFQPQNGNAAVPAQVADASSDDQDALDRFEQGLEDRLRRAQGEQPSPAVNSRSAQNNRRPVSRPESSGRSFDDSQFSDVVPSQQLAATSQGSEAAVVNPSAGGSTSGARLGPDTSRRGLADQQRNNALMAMDQKNQPAGSAADRGPASEEMPFQAESSLTVNVESNANLETVLTSNERLRALIQEQRPFLFRLNNNVFEVQFVSGNYTVSFRSGANNGRTVASTLQGIFNNSLRRSPTADRNATRAGLVNSLRN